MASDDNNADRYITLTGDRLHTPLRRAFFQAADFKAGLIASAINFSYYGLRSDDLVMPFAFGVGALALNCMYSGVWRIADAITRRSMFGSGAGLCIDTRPDSNTPPPSASHIAMARYMRGCYCFWTAAAGAFDAYGLSSLTGNLEEKFDAATYSASTYTRFYNGFQRFNKIARGEWVIVSTPPKVEATETKEVKSINPAPQPVATPRISIK